MIIHLRRPGQQVAPLQSGPTTGFPLQTEMDASGILERLYLTPPFPNTEVALWFKLGPRGSNLTGNHSLTNMGPKHGTWTRGNEMDPFSPGAHQQDTPIKLCRQPPRI